jgi:hypothetical protein
VIGAAAGPAGAACSAIADAIVAGLFGHAAGCATARPFGEIVDENVLDNYRCLACSYSTIADLTAVGGFEHETAGVSNEGRELSALARAEQSSAFNG